MKKLEESGDEAWLECVEPALMDFSWRNSLLRVVKQEVSSGTETGRNYISQVARVKYTGITPNSNSRIQSSLIVKRSPGSVGMLSYAMGRRLLSTEFKMYLEILPNMERLLNNCGDVYGRMWPSCLFARCYDTLILEDLSRVGYKPRKRLTLLDFRHVLLAISALARFHAMSAVLKEKFMMDPDDFSDYTFGIRNPSTEKRATFYIRGLAAAMRTWGDQWKDLAEDIHNTAEQFVGKVRSVSKLKEGFCVLNHGDPSLNNIMYKYCPYTGQVVDVKFVDFQACFYGSCGIDIQFLLTMTVSGDEREEHFSELVESYHRVLASSLKSFGYEGDPPTLDDILAEVRAMRYVGGGLASYLMNLVLAPEDAVVSFDEFQNNSKPEALKALFENSQYTNIMQSIFRQYIGTDVFK